MAKDQKSTSRSPEGLVKQHGSLELPPPGQKIATQPGLALTTKQAIGRMAAGTLEERMGSFYSSEFCGEDKELSALDFSRMTRIEKLEVMRNNGKKILQLKQQTNDETERIDQIKNRFEAEQRAKIQGQATSQPTSGSKTPD